MQYAGCIASFSFVSGLLGDKFEDWRLSATVVPVTYLSWKQSSVERPAAVEKLLALLYLVQVANALSKLECQVKPTSRHCKIRRNWFEGTCGAIGLQDFDTSIYRDTHYIVKLERAYKTHHPEYKFLREEVLRGSDSLKGLMNVPQGLLVPIPLGSGRIHKVGIELVLGTGYRD